MDNTNRKRARLTLNPHLVHKPSVSYRTVTSPGAKFWCQSCRSTVTVNHLILWGPHERAFVNFFTDILLTLVSSFTLSCFRRTSGKNLLRKGWSKVTKKFNKPPDPSYLSVYLPSTSLSTPVQLILPLNLPPALPPLSHRSLSKTLTFPIPEWASIVSPQLFLIVLWTKVFISLVSSPILANRRKWVSLCGSTPRLRII